MAPLWDNFRGKDILITGGSGFVGTAILYRLLTRAPDVGRIYIICRGGLRSVPIL